MAADRLRELDGWRTISVALVIVSHLATVSALSTPATAALFGPYGRLGVSIFFVISGFVICRGLLSEEAERGRISLGSFYVRRAFRILPALMLYVGAVLSIGLFGADGAAPTILRGLTFTCNFHTTDCGGWLGGHLWSLSYEEQFYLLFPPLLVALSRSRAALTVAALSAPAVALVLYAAHLQVAGTIVSGFVPIAFGVVAGLHERRLRGLVATLPGWSILVGAAALLALVRLSGSAAATAITGIALPPLIGFVLLRSVSGPALIRSWLASGPMVALGRVSYGIYLWQQVATMPRAGAGAAFYAVTVGACIVWAFLSARWIEVPLTRYGARIASGIGRSHVRRGAALVAERR